MTGPGAFRPDGKVLALDAARELVGVGLDLATAGRSLADTADPEKLRIVDATVNLTELGRLQPEFARAAHLLSNARTRVDRIDPAFRIPPVEDAIGTLSPDVLGELDARILGNEIMAGLGWPQTARHIKVAPDGEILRLPLPLQFRVASEPLWLIRPAPESASP